MKNQSVLTICILENMHLAYAHSNRLYYSLVKFNIHDLVIVLDCFWSCVLKKRNNKKRKKSYLWVIIFIAQITLYSFPTLFLIFSCLFWLLANLESHDSLEEEHSLKAVFLESTTSVLKSTSVIKREIGITRVVYDCGKLKILKSAIK